MLSKSYILENLVKNKIGILGGGIAGLSLSSFLNEHSVVLEKESTFGGLSRSYQLSGITYDIGPHIIFSKNEEVLRLHSSIIKVNQLRRSNKVFYKNRFIKYPFENDLSSLPIDDRNYCLNDYLKNPYENYTPKNMLQFFLSTFGEGITRLYLQPYNEKIWKFDPACMDLQMVERIPKPPRADVIDSANGKSTEGYLHQLNFYYPSSGGFQTLINAYVDRSINRGNSLKSNSEITKITKTSNGWLVNTKDEKIEFESIINCMPIHEFSKFMNLPSVMQHHLKKLLYNSIYIVLIKVNKDSIGENFALYLPDKDIIFHRLSKLNYLGPEYCPDDGGSILMAEVTFRPDSYLSTIDYDEIKKMVVDGLVKCKFIEYKDVESIEIKYEKYAYVIYDLDHRKNIDALLNYYSDLGIMCLGRFAEFEYLNTDGVVERALKMARNLNGDNKILGVDK